MIKNRKVNCSYLEFFDHCSKDQRSSIEVTEWNNGEGYTIAIGDDGNQLISVTSTEAWALVAVLAAIGITPPRSHE